jgi:hypothetical protein
LVVATMTLTRHIRRLLAIVALGTAAAVIEFIENDISRGVAIVLTSFVHLHHVGSSLTAQLELEQAAVYRQHHPPPPLDRPLRPRPVR